MPRSVKPSCTNGAEQDQVSFDPAKESAYIVSHAQPHGDPFKLLGICFDCKLRMDLAVRDVVSQASWELSTILRTRRFHGVSQLVQVYKSKVLSFVEYRTPAVHHAAKTTLAGIDALQRRFLRECGLSDEEALLHFNLAPLETRRDIAKLGLIHRSVLGGGPRHFANSFCPLHRRFPRNMTNNFNHTGPLVICKFCHAPHWDSLMSTICYPLTWFARRVWLPCSTNFRLFEKSECGTVTVIGFTPSLHVFLCMSTGWNCSHDFSLSVVTLDVWPNSEVLRQYAGDV